ERGRAFLEELSLAPADAAKLAHANADRLLGLTPEAGERSRRLPCRLTERARGKRGRGAFGGSGGRAALPAAKPPMECEPSALAGSSRLPFRAQLHLQLAEVLAAQEPDEGARRCLEALDDVLLVLEAAGAHPFAHLVHGRGGPAGEIR